MSLISISQGIALLFADDFASRFGIVFLRQPAMLLVISLVGAIRLRKPLEAVRTQAV